MAHERVPGRYPSSGPPPGTMPQAPPQLNGKLAANTNAAVLGPNRVLHGFQPIDVVVPGVATTRNWVLLATNDSSRPMAVRLRLSRNSTEGRIAIAPKPGGGIMVGGVYTPVASEYLDLTSNHDGPYECTLFENEQIWAIGTWPGMVPLSVVVTVLRWSPETG